jgi:hypothetical protein
MEENLNIIRNNQHYDHYDLLQKSLTPIAQNISDRAVVFVD